MRSELVKCNEVARWWNTARPLTHPSDYSRGGLAMNATQTAESWRPIPEWKYYEASSLGRIRSLDRWTGAKDGKTRRVRGRILRGIPTNSGYLCVTVSDDNARRAVMLVHRLVLLAFAGPCPAGREVLHANDDGLDNRVENLRYGTRSENNYDQVRNGGHFEATKASCAKGHPFDESNTRLTPKGTRKCRRCIREIQVAYRARK